MSEGIPEPRGTGEEICSVGVPSAREGEFVDTVVNFLRASTLTLTHCMTQSSAFVEVTTLRWVAANFMSSVAGFWGWKLVMSR